MIHLYLREDLLAACNSIIIIPAKAVEEAGYIQTLTEKNDASSKHEFHAMAQMAYFQFQDEELDITVIDEEIRIDSGGISEILPSGMVLCREPEGGFRVFIHDGLKTKKLLEAAYRFCTRWVRLDI